MGKCNSFDTGPGSGVGKLAEIEINVLIEELIDYHLDVRSGLRAPFILGVSLVDKNSAITYLQRVSDIGILLTNSHPHALIRGSCSNQQVGEIKVTSESIVNLLNIDSDSLSVDYPGYQTFLENCERYVDL